VPVRLRATRMQIRLLGGAQTTVRIVPLLRGRR
jgi:hypothetical protein